jgi:signal transduction histidine kinase
MMGKGAVGGSMLNFEDISTRASEIVLALLRGAKVSDFPIEPSTNRITIDWKQLQKFRLPAKAVPSSAQILFQEPNVWNRYGWYIALGMVVFLLQSTLIIKLIIEGRKRKYSEASARQLAGRLIHAQEEERHRIARELHDDLSQRMAMVSIRVDTLRASPPDTENALVEQLTNIYEEADSISSEIHQLSHELHSTVLERLGLVAAIRHYCNEFSVHRRIPVSVQIDGEEVPLEKEIALVLFRVTQECLANTAKHSDATSCNLRLSYHNRRVELEVKDDGCGFAAGKVTQREGLGIESMRERLRSVGGTFQIRSKLSGGTTVCAEIPTGQATSGSATPKTTSNSPKAAAA